jgi:DNA-binding LytR/AlgR family response regulator
MTLVEAAPSDDMRVILCLKFDRRAPSDAVTRFKQDLIDCPSVLHSVEVTGAFDYVIEAGIADFPAYHALLDCFGQELATLVERHEASFVCRRFMRVCDRDDAIWVPCRDGRRRIACSTIDMVRAEGDYVRLYCGEQSWLLHDTLHHMRDVLDPRTFLTVHRSTIVNVGFIRQLVHRRHYWVMLLDNGSEQRIAKSHVAAVLSELRTDSSNERARPATRRPFNESNAASMEQQVPAPPIAAMMRH